jgi:hypothetical protein
LMLMQALRIHAAPSNWRRRTGRSSCTAASAGTARIRRPTSLPNSRPWQRQGFSLGTKQSQKGGREGSGGGCRRERLGFLMDRFGAGPKGTGGGLLDWWEKWGHALFVLERRRRNRAGSLLWSQKVRWDGHGFSSPLLNFFSSSCRII